MTERRWRDGRVQRACYNVAMPDSAPVTPTQAAQRVKDTLRDVEDAAQDCGDDERRKLSIRLTPAIKANAARPVPAGHILARRAPQEG